MFESSKVPSSATAVTAEAAIVEEVKEQLGRNSVALSGALICSFPEWQRGSFPIMIAVVMTMAFKSGSGDCCILLSRRQRKHLGCDNASR